MEMPKGANFAFIPTSSRGGKKFDETQSANGCRREWKLAHSIAEAAAKLSIGFQPHFDVMIIIAQKIR